MARNRFDEQIFFRNPEACKFCLLAAILLTCPELEGMVREHLDQTIGQWNDDPRRKWEDIVQLVQEFDACHSK